MKLSQPRPGTYLLTLTAHELTTLLAGARMSLAVIEDDPGGATGSARHALGRVMADLDAALARLRAEEDAERR